MILDKDLFNKKIEDKKLRPSASGLMRKLNDNNFPLINNNKYGYNKKDSESNSQISDKNIFDKRSNKINEISKYNKDNDSLNDSNIIKYKTLYNKKSEKKGQSKGKFGNNANNTNKKETFNLSSDSDTLGSDFNKLNNNNNEIMDKKMRKFKEAGRISGKNIDNIGNNDKKDDELAGIFFFFV